MIGLIATKEGMTRLFQEDGKSLPVSVLKVATNFVSQIKTKETLFRNELKHPEIIELTGMGLMLAAIVKNSEMVDRIIEECLKKGVLLFRLLWKKNALRISPPLTISEREIKKGCKIIREVLNTL